MHDFAAKLRQRGTAGLVAEYVRWQRAQRAALARGETPPPLPRMAPISINLDLTTACNYACDHCIDWDILNTKHRHADDELRSSMTTLAARGLRCVIVIGGGEPTLYPGFADFVGHLKGLGLQVAVVSNGSRNDRILEAAAHLRAGDWVRLSLDAGSNQTFRAMHKPSKAGLDLDEICGWIPRIKDANDSFDLGYSFIITWKGASRDDVGVVENIGEMAQAARRARDAGLAYISFNPLLARRRAGRHGRRGARCRCEGRRVRRELRRALVHGPVRPPGGPDGARGRLADVLAKIEAELEVARGLEGDGFRVMESTNLRMLMRGTWREYTRQPRTCHMQALRQVVTPLGVFNCPAYRGVERAKIGDKAIYKDEASADRAFARTADIVSRFDASAECSEITCLYHSTNWWLEQLIESGEEVDAATEDRADPDYFL